MSGSYRQGMTQAAKDELDGYRDASAVIRDEAEPDELCRSADAITPAYISGARRAWDELVGADPFLPDGSAGFGAVGNHWMGEVG